jgi:hypothetical protein
MSQFFECRTWIPSSRPFLDLKVTSKFLPSQPRPMILVPSPPRALLSDLEPNLRGLRPANGKRPSTRATKRRPRKPPGNLRAESRSLTPNLRLLLRLLHRGLGRASRSSDRKGIVIFIFFHFHLPIKSTTFYVECLKISFWPHLQRTLHLRANPQWWTSPGVHLLEKPSQKHRSTRAQNTLMPQLVPQVFQLPHLLPTRDTMLLTNLQG